MRAYERLLKYVKVHTTSDPNSGTHPSTLRQFDLAKILVEELKELGLTDAHVDEHCYVYATLPATPGQESAAPLGLIAHMDTADDASGENVRPQIHENYDGEAVTLPATGTVLDPKVFPFLREMKGQTLITTDGSTLLGADDKAGVAEIMTALERIIAENRPHGKLCIGFTPDEEIGEGADHFDVAGFGAEYAYTVDGGAIGELEYENFNATSALVEIAGLSIHPGSACGKMVNASLVAMEFASLLPALETPYFTNGYEGFFHLTDMEGSVEHAKLSYIIRDHDREKFEARKAVFEKAAKEMDRRYGGGTVKLTIRDSYYNMKEKIEPCMFLVDQAKSAMLELGIAPKVQPIRGGTDGARLSFLGLPCPNLCAGGENFHGRFEYVPVEDMEKITKLLATILWNIAK